MSSSIFAPSAIVAPFAVAFADGQNNASIVAQGNPLPVTGAVAVSYNVSGLTPVTGSITAGNQSAGFTPIPGRDFNITVLPTGGGPDTAQIERRFAGDSAWYAVITDALRANMPPSFVWSESEAGVAYRVNVFAGAFTVRLSQ